MDLSLLYFISIAGFTVALALFISTFILDLIAKHFLQSIKRLSLIILACSFFFGVFVVANTFMMHGFVQGFPILKDALITCLSTVKNYTQWIDSQLVRWIVYTVWTKIYNAVWAAIRLIY